MILVVPPGGETLALNIFNLLHYGHNAQVNALCLILLGIAVVPLLAWQSWSVISNQWYLTRDHALRNTHHGKRNTEHGASIVMLTLIPLLLAGCDNNSRSKESPLTSQ